MDQMRPLALANAGAPDRRSTEERGASELLLALLRLGRKPRHGGEMPARLKALAESGELAPRHLTAFALVALEGPMTVSELAAREGLAVSTASLLVTQLSEAGLVERREDVADRRRTVVSVSPAHRAESEEALAGVLAPLRRAVDRLGPKRAAVLVELLGVLADEMNRDEAGLDEEVTI